MYRQYRAHLMITVQEVPHIEEELGCVPVMITAVGTYAVFRSHLMTAYRAQTVNGNGIISKMHMWLR